MGSRWVLAGFQGAGGEIGGRSLCGILGEVAGDLGEIGEGIPEDFGGVPGFGLLWKDGRKVRRFWVVFSGRKVLSLSGNSLESSVSLPGCFL